MKKVFALALSAVLLALFFSFLHGCASAGPGTYGLKSSEKDSSAGLDPLFAHSLRTPNDELWVIEKAPAGKSGRSTDSPTTGTLVRDLNQTSIPVPLKRTAVRATITAFIASVEVTQTFHNPFPDKIEAIYTFPLPENAGIHEFIMTIGDRRIRGIVREREQAQKIYEKARQQGYIASLLVQDRPNLFTQRVANIEPGKQIDIHIRYLHTLAYNDGEFEWVFPMVVGPRYPGESQSAGMGNSSVGAPSQREQAAEVQYLKPTQRSGHDISLQVHVDAGVTVESLTSVNHAIHKSTGNKGRVTVELDPADAIPNKDFVLRYKVAGAQTKSAMRVQHSPSGDGGYFTLMLVPPESLRTLPRRPVEMIFVVDASESMLGAPLRQIRAAIKAALARMNSDDTFQIVQFAESAMPLAPTPLAATPANRRTAEAYLQSIKVFRSTKVLEGLHPSLNLPTDESRTRIVVFLSDGYMGEELPILRTLYEPLAGTRVLSVGLGASPNRYLLDSLARIGHGATAYLAPNDDAQPIMDAYFERISRPALSNISLEFEGLQVADVYPRKIPDLFAGKPVIITGRYTGKNAGNAIIRGTAGSERVRLQLSMADGNTDAPESIRTVWARMKIADLHDHALRTRADVTKAVRETALELGLVSPYTAFLAVDSMQKTSGPHGTPITVPVPMPEGVRNETPVNDK